MTIHRREFLKTLAVASAGGLGLHSEFALAQRSASSLYDLPKFGNVNLLHFTDCHAQLLPIHFREPSINIGIGSQSGKSPHLVNEYFLKENGIQAGSRFAHAFTSLNFAEAAKTYGRMGGFSYLATLVKQLKVSRPNALLLDGGDTWQGSATALWSKAQDMVDTSLALGVDVMTAHWEMTYGEKRVLEIVQGDLHNKIDFIAQNIKTADFGDDVFPSYTLRNQNGILVAIIGQAFPYTPIANPSYFTPNWTFGIQEENLQKIINEVKSKGAKLVVLLSHNGMDVDLKLASRVRGLHFILGGHTHDGIPKPIVVKNPGGVTLVTNAGSNGKYLGVLDVEIKGSQLVDYRYKLLPVFSNLIPKDPKMAHLIENIRKPFEAKLNEKLAVNHDLLYRRGNFNGSFDQVLLDALMVQKDAQITFSPGFRWGTTLLPGEPITVEDLMNQTAITYPYTTVNMLSGETIKTILEDVADNLFNPDPYYQQGGDMVRVGGLKYTINPNASMGNRISEMRLNGELIQASKLYKVAGWAPVSEVSREIGGEPIWDIVAKYLRDVKTIKSVKINHPHVQGVSNNWGYSAP